MTKRQGFEALNYALRKTRDGVIVSFVVHPNDVTPQLMALPVGARVQIHWHEIGDDEQEIGGGGLVVPVQGRVGAGSNPALDAVPETRPKRERSLAESCAIVCADARYWDFLDRKIGNRHLRKETLSEEWATNATRQLCGVVSRSELNTDHPNFSAEAARKWVALHQEFRNDQAGKDYDGAVR